MPHFHIYRPFVFPVGSTRVERYDIVPEWYEVRMTANRYARRYDNGLARAMVKQCLEDYCISESEEYFDE